MKNLEVGSSTNHVTSYIDDLIVNRHLLRVLSRDIDIHQKYITVVIVNINHVLNVLSPLYDSTIYLHQLLTSSSGTIVNRNNGNYIKYYCSGGTATFTVVGDVQFVETNISIIKSNFDERGSYIKWWYSEKDYIRTPLNLDMLPVDSMYPFLGEESLNDYYQRFIDSSANILLLIGPPGTGKSTFIRGLLNYSRSSAVVTYDPELLRHDRVFVDFVQDNDCSFLILEDSDTFLSARTEGNTMMHRFLNVSSGLVSSQGKKLIFSTNLPSIRDIDPALIRPGRCFDIVKFDQLNKDQATKISKELGISIDDKPSRYTIAEIFHESNKKQVKQSFGFIQE